MLQVWPRLLVHKCPLCINACRKLGKRTHISAKLQKLLFMAIGRLSRRFSVLERSPRPGGRSKVYGIDLRVPHGLHSQSFFLRLNLKTLA
jgi:hypothetical protein